MNVLSPREMVAQVRALEKVFGEADVKAVRTAAAQAKAIQLRHLREAAPRLVMRVGKTRNQRIGVGYQLTTMDGRPAAILKARGAVHLLERNTKAHVIPRGAGSAVTHTATGRRRKKVGTARGGGVVKFNGVVRSVVHHPGTRGKHPWERGAEEVAAKVHISVFDEIHKGVLKVIG